MNLDMVMEWCRSIVQLHANWGLKFSIPPHGKREFWGDNCYIPTPAEIYTKFQCVRLFPAAKHWLLQVEREQDLLVQLIPQFMAFSNELWIDWIVTNMRCGESKMIYAIDVMSYVSVKTTFGCRESGLEWQIFI